MSIKQKLEYGIFPIASRRHQPRDTFHKFSHLWTPDESVFVIVTWLLTPVYALFGPILSNGQFDYGESLILMVVMNLFLTYLVRAD